MSHLSVVSKSILISIASASLLSFGIAAQAVSQGSTQQTDAQQQFASAQSPGIGQGKSQSDTDAKDMQGSQSGGKIIFVQKSSQVLASSIMGMSIQDGTNKDAAQIGTINDLIMNKHHQLAGIVVGVGGFLGIGQKNVGIPWSDVRDIDPKKGVAVVDVTKKELAEAPAFTTKREMQQKAQQQKLLQKQRQEAKERQQQQQETQDLMRQKAPQKQDSQ